MKFVKFLILFILLSINLIINAEDKILPLATGEWPPYTSEQLAGYGYLTEIVTAVVHEMGMKPEYFFCPWVRCERLTRIGEVFGTFPYAVTEVRKMDFEFSDYIVKNRVSFFYNKKHLKNKIKLKSLKDLKNYLIGGVKGYSYVPQFTNAGLNVDYADVDEQSVLKLYFNRIDIAVIDLMQGWFLIKKNFPDEIELFATFEKSLGDVEPSLKEGDSHLMISRKYPDSKKLHRLFDQALIRIKRKGIYQAILKKHGIK